MKLSGTKRLPVPVVGLAAMLLPVLGLDTGRVSADDLTLDLLSQAKVRVVDTTLPLEHRQLLTMLRDGDETTSVVLPVGVGTAVGFTYELPEVATLKQLVLRLPEATEENTLRRMNVFASTISAHAGFHLLRVDPRQSRDDPEVFTFRPVAAKWIRLEILPAPSAKHVALTEVQALGGLGLPQTRYAFKESPAQAKDVLAQLGKLADVDVRLTDEERLLLNDARDGKLDDWTFAEAALLVDGVERGDRRQGLLQKLDVIAAAAGEHLDNSDESFQRASDLLSWLYSEGYLKQYSSNQSSLVRLLSDGTYNCVSSAILYSIIGCHLGLDVQAVEVPDHVFAIVYDGARHADIETTIATGFRPASKSLKTFRSLTGFEYIPDSPDKRRKLTLPGLLALVAYNRGVELGKQRRYALAVGAYFRAMSLDGDNATAVKNALATLAAWSRVCAESRNYGQFVAMINIGLQLAPKDEGFLHSRMYGWQMWINETVQRGDSEEALELVRRAAREVSGEHFAPLVTWVYISPAEAKVAKGDFAGALLATDTARKTLQGKSLAEIREYRANLMQRWYAHELQAGRHAAAAKALDQALLLPATKTARIEQSYAYLVEQWLAAVRAQRGPDVAEKLHQGLSKRYGKIDAVRDALRGSSYREIYAHVQDKQFSTAWRVAECVAENDPSHGNSMRVYVLSHWGVQRAAAKDWGTATKLFRRARSYDADSDQLVENEKSSVLNWALQSSRTRPWKETLEILDEARGRFPHDQSVVDMEIAMWWSQAEPYMKAKRWDDALAIIKQARSRHAQNARLRQNEKHLWSQKVQPAFQSQRWAEGLAVMSAARLRFPDESTFTRNELTCFRQLVKRQMETRDWKAAISTLSQASK